MRSYLTMQKLTNITPLHLRNPSTTHPLPASMVKQHKHSKNTCKQQQKFKYQYFLSNYIIFYIHAFISHYARLFKYSSLTSDLNIFIIIIIINNNVIEMLSYNRNGDCVK